MRDVPRSIHGTEAGYVKHYRTRVPPCQACRAAHCEYLRAWRQRTGRVAAARRTGIPDTPATRAGIANLIRVLAAALGYPMSAEEIEAI